jgi:hypothetical protein
MFRLGNKQPAKIAAPDQRGLHRAIFGIENAKLMLSSIAFSETWE